MKVWIVEEVCPEGTANIMKVFTTEERAEAFADEKQKDEKIMAYYVKAFDVED